MKTEDLITMDNETRIGRTLKKIWSLQQQYNQNIYGFMAAEAPYSVQVEHWVTNYLLGMVSEIDEILREINWKQHRKDQHKAPVQRNIALELADLTKYVICLWQICGFDIADMLSYTVDKSLMLHILQMQSQRAPKPGQVVVLADLDGTVADWRASFLQWLKQQEAPIPRQMAQEAYKLNLLVLDVDLKMRFSQYTQFKEKFEETGGYANLIPYHDALIAIKQLRKQENAYLIVYTARPVSKYKYIWMDTWNWLDQEGIMPEELHIGQEERIRAAEKLLSTNPILAFEDNPEIALRLANAGIHVYVRSQPYNTSLKQLKHPFIHFVAQYTDIDPAIYIAEPKADLVQKQLETPDDEMPF
jgi:hypothetical protein